MSTQKPDGGPAFPVVDVRQDWDDNVGRGEWGWIYTRTISSGLSLRDYFAGQALAGALTGVYLQHADADWTIRNIAERAYQVADAMLAEREK